MRLSRDAPGSATGAPAGVSVRSSRAHALSGSRPDIIFLAELPKAKVCTPYSSGYKERHVVLKPGFLLYYADKGKLKVACGALVIETTFDNVSWMEMIARRRPGAPGCR